MRKQRTQCVTDIANAEKVIYAMRTKRVIYSLDIETNTTQLEQPEAVIGIGVESKLGAFYFPIRHHEEMLPVYPAGEAFNYEEALVVWEAERSLPKRERTYPKKPTKPKKRTFAEQIDVPLSPHNLDPLQLYETLLPLLRDPGCLLIAHNSPFDLRGIMADMQRLGLSDPFLPPKFADTMIMAYALALNLLPGGALGLDPLAARYLKQRKDEAALEAFFDDRKVRGKTKRKGLLWCAPLRAVSDYCGQDCRITRRLAAVLGKALSNDDGCTRVYRRELALVGPTIRMEMEPKHLNIEYVRERCATGAREVNKRRNRLYKIAGQTFNPNSPKQLASVLRDADIALPMTQASIDAGHEGDEANYSTAKAVLEDHTDKPIVQALFSYRWLEKRVGTYFEAMKRLEIGGKIYPGIAQTRARTGRASSSRPNFQNLPVRDESEEAQRWSVRRAVIPGPGKLLLSADLSQIEPRCMAHLTRDRRLIAVYQEGRDIYVELGKYAFDVDHDLSDLEWKAKHPDLRTRAKAVMLAIGYGAGKAKVASMVGCTVDYATTIIERLENRFPGIWSYQEDLIRECHHKGFVRAPSGRKLYLAQEGAEYALFNAITQGYAADLLKEGTLAVDEGLRHAGLDDVRLLLPVHDELLFTTSYAQIEAALPIIQEGMTNMGLRVPLKLDFAVSARSWADLIEFSPTAGIPWEALREQAAA